MLSPREAILIDEQWTNIIGGDASETGSGPGSYDIRKSVWHVNVSMTEWSIPRISY